jgi:DHA3 family macrolide efflux protein-like MFS transporter
MQQSRLGWKARFFTIWTGQAFSLLGSRLVQFGLVWYLTETTGSATVLSIATTMAVLPEIVLSPFAGALVDRWNRRLVMIVSDSAIALATLALGVLFALDAVQVWHIYALMFVRAAGGAFQWPAMQASTSLMVPTEHLARVAGLNQALLGAVNVISPPLGALLLETLPMQGTLAVDVVTAVLAVGPLLFVRVPQPEREEREDRGSLLVSVLADVRAGWRYVAAWPGLVALIGTAMIFKLALTPTFSLLPLLVRDHFGGGAALLSLVEAVVGVGVVLGGLLLSAWGGFRRKIYTTLVGTTVLGLGLLVVGVTPGDMFPFALGSAFVVGLMIPLIDGPIMAIAHATIAPEMQGRVFTLLSSLLWLTSPFSLAIAGPVSDWLGLQIWFVVAGVMCALFAPLGFFVPVLVHIEENANGGSGKDRAR